MSHHSNLILYIVFTLVVGLVLIYDLGLLRLKGRKETQKNMISSSIIKTFIWIFMGLAFSLYILYERGQNSALEYVTAFLMEWSLSVDNIFVFILLFSGFKLTNKEVEKTLLIGVILAIVLRIIFIAVGISIVSKFEWLFYVFAVFLVYTGIKIFTSKEEKESGKEMKQSKTSQFISKWLRTTSVKGYKFFVKVDGKWYTTPILLVVVLIAITDITFALDSIPAVLAISKDTLIIYTSNIFAVLGLRSLFFALQGAKEKFKYLPKGIGIVLVFVGVKIFVGEYFAYHIPTPISLGFIVVVFGLSVLISFLKAKVSS